MENADPQVWLSPFLALWKDLNGVAPRIVAALAVVLAGLACAWLVGKVALGLFKGLRLDQRLAGLWVQRYWDRSVAEQPSKALAHFVFYCCLTGALLLAVRVLGVGLGDAVLAALLPLLPRILTFVLVIFIGALLANVLALVTQLALSGAGVQRPHLVGKLVAWGTLGVSLLFSLDQLGLAGQFLTQLILVAAGGLALAFGLGCKDLAKEFVLEMLREDGGRKGRDGDGA